MSRVDWLVLQVLLDAPCTGRETLATGHWLPGSGIIARDPSVKVKRGQKELFMSFQKSSRRFEDFEGHSRLQKELLTAAIDMVDAGPGLRK